MPRIMTSRKRFPPGRTERRARNARDSTPPSPSLSARRTKITYLTVTMSVIAHTMVETTPSALSRVGSTMPPSRLKTVCIAYKGLVPMSPKTTPRAPRTRMRRPAVCPTGLDSRTIPEPTVEVRGSRLGGHGVVERRRSLPSGDEARPSTAGGWRLRRRQGPRHEAVEHRMTVIQATFIGVGSMVGAGIFALLGAAGAVAGSAVWVSFLVAGAIAGLQGYSFAKLGATYPSGGGMLAYLARGFGEGHATGIVSWLFYVTGAIVGAMVASSFGGYASAVLTGRDPTWAKVFAVALIVLMTFLNAVGSTAVAKVQSLIVKAVLAILSVFAIVTIANWNPALLDPAGYPGVREIIASVALTFFAFLGFGVITFTAKDLPDPSRQLPRAMYLALGIATVVYVGVALGVFGTLTVDQVIASGGTALAEAAKPTLGQFGYVLMVVTALFSTTGATNASLYPAVGF